MSYRDYKDPLYKEWRSRVRARDKHRCQMPGCNKRGKNNQVHHIKRWADYPSLRYEESNGITLCFFCHKTVTTNEPHYERLFTGIIDKTYGDNPRH
jgi:5-methylcytosine-specific restriction endonuclease McrA